MIRRIRKIILVVGDVIVVYAGLLMTVVFGFWGKFSWHTFSQHLFPFSMLYLTWLVMIYIFDLYNLNISRDKFLFYVRFLQVLAVSGVLGIAFFYLWPAFGITPKTNLALNIIFFGGLLLLWRKIFYYAFSKRLIINAGLLGQNKEALKLAREIMQRPYLGYKLKTIFSSSEKPQQLPLIGVKTSTISKDFFNQLKKQKIDVLIVGESLKPNSEITKTLYECLSSSIVFMNLPHAYEVICGKVPISFINKTWFLENIKEGEKTFYNKLKRIFDLILSFVLLILTSPLWLLIALLIKLEDKGSIFYKQKRIGRDKKEFYLIKFRSMRKNAENGKAIWAKKNDKRITKVGKILRATHLDELPQMLNVIKGEISLVGPRPERTEFVSELENKIPHYHLRHLIKPGVTGWDQIKFKYANTLKGSFEKFEYDLFYLKNRNLFLDFGILLKTFQSLFRKTN